MKAVLFLAIVASSSCDILPHIGELNYDGKIEVPITEEAAIKLCRKMGTRLFTLGHVNKTRMMIEEMFYQVPLEQPKHHLDWWQKANRHTALAEKIFMSGCFRWVQRPCYGYYPNTFNHPCTFWQPDKYPGGKCIFQYARGTERFLQKAVTVDGKSAAQICDSVGQSAGKISFSMHFMPLKLNLRSTVKCETWKYTPVEESGDWDVEVVDREECDKMYPDYEIDELEDPIMSAPTCLATLSREIECFFTDNNFPIEKQMEIDSKFNSK